MDKKTALVISFLFTLLIVGNSLFFYDFDSGKEKVIIARVIDGDTVKLEDGRTVRLLNVNTPEKGEFMSKEGKKFLQGFENETVEMVSVGVGKYGRVLGKLYSGEYLNLGLVKRGLAHVYMAEEEELKEFKKTERSARERGLGIWERSEYYGCLTVEINKYDEYVVLEIKCGDLNGWTLKDESTKRYVFDESALDKAGIYSEDGGGVYSGDDNGAGIGLDKVWIYSGEGLDGEGKLYWGQGNVWNNDKDSIFILDNNGKLVYYDSYGY